MYLLIMGLAVDICITTDWKELEGVCMIADLLARSEYIESLKMHCKTDILVRWYERGHLRVNCQGSHSQDIGS